MKKRLILATVLFVISLFVLMLIVGLTGMHCQQYVDTSSTPLQCSAMQDGVLGVIANIGIFGLVFAAAGTAAGLYYRFGWPRDKSN